MDIWIATGNKGKMGEFKLLFDRDLPAVKLHSTLELPVFSAPPENGNSFLDNARIKARSIRALKPEYWTMGEDSGLEVEALGNLPGIHSARYAGPHARDSENTAKLLKMMQLRAGPNRQARFLCTMVVYSPQRSDGSYDEFIYVGEMKGQIGKAPVGQMGFGYDPVFIPEGETKTMAELGPGFKNKHSHRAKATLQFIDQLKKIEIFIGLELF